MTLRLNETHLVEDHHDGQFFGPPEQGEFDALAKAMTIVGQPRAGFRRVSFLLDRQPIFDGDRYVNNKFIYRVVDAKIADPQLP